MNKLIFSTLAAGMLASGGAAFAQASGYDAAHSENTPTCGRVFGTPYHTCAGGTPPTEAQVYVAPDPRGNRAFAPRYDNAPAYPYVVPDRRTRRDRDGDGVDNRSDRYPDDPNRR